MKKLTNGRVGSSHNSVKSDHRNATLTGELEKSQFDPNESSVNC
jgi:hypothetical protein